MTIRTIENKLRKAGYHTKKVTKNNGTVFHGIIKDGNSPIVYVEDFLDKEDPVTEIIDIFERYNVPEIDVAGAITMENIIPVLVNRKMNDMTKIPHIDFLDDLAITFSIKVNESSTAKVNNPSLLKALGNPSKEELLVKAAKNMGKPVIKSMFDMLTGLGMPIEDFTPTEMPMYVMTNKDALFGANAILDRDSMVTLTEKFEDDIWIIPSSVHEVIVIPRNCGMDIKDLTEMICSVNESEVAAHEVLGTHPYLFSREKRNFVF